MRFAAAMRGAPPRNSSLIFRWVLAIATFVVTMVAPLGALRRSDAARASLTGHATWR
jgi:hypothetical protein